MRILLTGQAYAPDPNGQAVFTTRLAEKLALQGNRVSVVLPGHDLHSHKEVRNGVRLYQIRALSLAPWYRYVRVAIFSPGTIVGLIDTIQPQIIHIQDHYPLARSILQVAKERQIPIVGTNHFLPENLMRNLPIPSVLGKVAKRFLWRTMLVTYNQLDAVAAPTATAVRILQEQHIRPSIRAISCGIDTSRFRPYPSEDRTKLRHRYAFDQQKVLFLYVGRLDHEKRPDLLLRALGHLQHSKVQLGIVGRGSHEKGLKKLAQVLHLQDRVVFPGYVPSEELPALLASADAFIMPSEAELQSIATLEAMSSGLPVIAANACALPELVEHGANGYLFRSGDAKDLAQQMERFLEEQGRWAAMGEASRRKAAFHSLSSTIEHYLRLYHDVLQGSPLPAD